MATVVSPGQSRSKARPSRSRVAEHLNDSSSDKETEIDFSKFADKTDKYDKDMAIIVP